jgi:hypothetical protein
LAEGLLYKEIGVLVGRDPSIISREVRRHGGRAGYRTATTSRAHLIDLAVAAQVIEAELLADTPRSPSHAVAYALRRNHLRAPSPHPYARTGVSAELPLLSLEPS